MHNRIIQVGLEPIKENDYFSEVDFCESHFMYDVADYVSDDCDRARDIDALRGIKGCLVASDERGEYLQVVNKEEYFAPAFDRFKSLLKGLADCSLADFAEGRVDMWEIGNAYEMKFDTYFYFDSDDIVTFDEFVRNAITGTKYYIGGTMDYHY